MPWGTVLLLVEKVCVRSACPWSSPLLDQEEYLFNAQPEAGAVSWEEEQTLSTQIHPKSAETGTTALLISTQL